MRARNTSTASTVNGFAGNARHSTIQTPGSSRVAAGVIRRQALMSPSRRSLERQASVLSLNIKRAKQCRQAKLNSNFKSANFNFHSTSYDWLVVSGARAQYKGTGTVNNAGSYGFILTAIDGAVKGGGGVDKFRIKITDKSTGAAVYDNQLGRLGRRRSQHSDQRGQHCTPPRSNPAGCPIFV
jgi:hypothetical protein